MILKPLMSFLRTTKLSHTTQELIQKFFLLASLQTIIFMVSSTIYALFVIDKVGYEVLGILLSISFIVQFLLDYPSGVLGDWIGQKWILATAFITFALSYGLLAFANSFIEFAFVYVLSAIARSQESGALQSWFDNNYKFSADRVDPKREIYQEVFGKFNSLFGFIGAGAFIFGGTLATVLNSRGIVFFLQAFGMFGFAILCLLIIKNFPGMPKPEKTFQNYFSLLAEGLRFSVSKHVFFYILSVCIESSIFIVWMEMMLFPMYYGYTGSDFGVALFRFIIFILNSLTALKASVWSKKFNVRKWIPRFELIIMITFCSFFAVLIYFFPLNNQLNFVAIALVIIFFFLWYLVMNTSIILRQRLILDLVPDKNRNSFYSLLPTAILITSTPVVFFAGMTIEVFEFPLTLSLLLILGLVACLLLFLSLRFLPKNILNEEKDTENLEI